MAVGVWRWEFGVRGRQLVVWPWRRRHAATAAVGECSRSQGPHPHVPVSSTRRSSYEWSAHNRAFNDINAPMYSVFSFPFASRSRSLSQPCASLPLLSLRPSPLVHGCPCSCAFSFVLLRLHSLRGSFPFARSRSCAINSSALFKLRARDNEDDIAYLKPFLTFFVLRFPISFTSFRCFLVHVAPSPFVRRVAFDSLDTRAVSC